MCSVELLSWAIAQERLERSLVVILDTSFFVALLEIDSHWKLSIYPYEGNQQMSEGSH